MVFLIHLLEHMGVPSGAAIAIVITGKKFLKGGATKLRGPRDRDGNDHAGGGDRRRR